MLIAAGLTSGAILSLISSCLVEDFDEAAMTLAEVAPDVEGGPEVMHVSAVQVDGTAMLGLGWGWLVGVAPLALGRGRPPLGGGLLLLGVRILLSAVGDEIMVSNCHLL